MFRIMDQRLVKTFYEDDAKKFWQQHMWDIKKEVGSSNLLEAEKVATPSI